MWTSVHCSVSHSIRAYPRLSQEPPGYPGGSLPLRAHPPDLIERTPQVAAHPGGPARGVVRPASPAGGSGVAHRQQHGPGAHPAGGGAPRAAAFRPARPWGGGGSRRGGLAHRSLPCRPGAPAAGGPAAAAGRPAALAIASADRVMGWPGQGRVALSLQGGSAQTPSTVARRAPVTDGREPGWPRRCHHASSAKASASRTASSMPSSRRGCTAMPGQR